MGIELGAPKESIARCPSLSAALNSKTICTAPDPSSNKLESLYGFPFGFNRGGYVSYVDGHIAQIDMIVGHSDFERLKGILIERYGAPTSTSTDSVTAGSGAVLTSEELTWIGKNVSIVLTERQRSVDRSNVAFAYGPLVRASTLNAEKDRRREAGKL